MPTLLRRSGRVIARGLGLVLGLLGGLAWATCLSLLCVGLYRLGWLPLTTMAMLIGICLGCFGVAGLAWSKRFMSYALPVLELVFTDESATDGKATVREVVVVVALAVAVVALALGAVFKSALAIGGGALAFGVYALLAPGIFDRKAGADAPE